MWSCFGHDALWCHSDHTPSRVGVSEAFLWKVQQRKDYTLKELAIPHIDLPKTGMCQRRGPTPGWWCVATKWCMIWQPFLTSQSVKSGASRRSKWWTLSDFCRGSQKLFFFAGVHAPFFVIVMQDSAPPPPQTSTSVWRCLVTMAAPVGTWWDPSSASVPRVSVGSAVRQVESMEEEELSGVWTLTIRTYTYTHTRVLYVADVNECLSEPCEHGGTCEDRLGSYVCHCPQGFRGLSCELGTGSTNQYLSPTTSVSNLCSIGIT